MDAKPKAGTLEYFLPRKRTRTCSYLMQSSDSNKRITPNTPDLSPFLYVVRILNCRTPHSQLVNKRSPLKYQRDGPAIHSTGCPKPVFRTLEVGKEKPPLEGNPAKATYIQYMILYPSLYNIHGTPRTLKNQVALIHARARVTLFSSLYLTSRHVLILGCVIHSLTSLPPLQLRTYLIQVNKYQDQHPLILSQQHDHSETWRTKSTTRAPPARPRRTCPPCPIRWTISMAMWRISPTKRAVTRYSLVLPQNPFAFSLSRGSEH